MIPARQEVSLLCFFWMVSVKLASRRNGAFKVVGEGSNSVKDLAAKRKDLLHAYISQLKLDEFVLGTDMVFVQQSAGRLVF